MLKEEKKMMRKLFCGIFFVFIGFILQSCMSTSTKENSLSSESSDRQPSATRQKELFLTCHLLTGQVVNNRSYVLMKIDLKSKVANYSIFSKGQQLSSATNGLVAKLVEPYFNNRNRQWEFYVELNLGRAGSLKMGWHPELQPTLPSIEHKGMFSITDNKAVQAHCEFNRPSSNGSSQILE
jgi:hypothetical protein